MVAASPIFCYIIVNPEKINTFASRKSKQIHKVKNRMYLTTENKKEIFKTYGKSEADTGSAEGQVAIFTTRINHLTQHLLTNKKDYSTQRALLKLVGKRRKLLDYLKEKDIERYRAIIKSLKIRK
jgi:small subunit ribosomal protein S15